MNITNPKPLNITSAQYYRVLVDKDTYENTGVKATIDGQEMSVPLDPANRHYAAILEWAEEDGNTIEEAN